MIGANARAQLAFPHAQRGTFDVVPLLQKQARGDGAIDSTAHRDYDLLLHKIIFVLASDNRSVGDRPVAPTSIAIVIAVVGAGFKPAPTIANAYVTQCRGTACRAPTNHPA